MDGVRYLAIEGEAPRVKICLAYRRDDRNPALMNFVAVARRAIRPPVPGKNIKTADRSGKVKVPQS